MREWKKKIRALACLLPAAAVFVCMFFSLRAYVKPTFQAEAIGTDEVREWEQTASPTPKTSAAKKPKINIQKKVALPSASEQKVNSESETETAKTSAKTKNSDTDGYEDGIYYGTGDGFEGEIKVKVTIKKGKINKIEIVKSQDGKSYLERASALLSKIIKKQSTDVDVVSGATYSSKGIIEAIKNALAGAKKVTPSETKRPSRTAAPTAAPSPTTAPSFSTENSETPVYADGEYQANVVCNPNTYADFDAYTLSLKIAIENDRVISVTDVNGSGVLYDSDNDWYIKRAVNGTSKYPGVVGQILSKGTCEGVDAVSGATCSSNAIIGAVKKAMESAKK